MQQIDYFTSSDIKLLIFEKCCGRTLRLLTYTCKSFARVISNGRLMKKPFDDNYADLFRITSLTRNFFKMHLDEITFIDDYFEKVCNLMLAALVHDYEFIPIIIDRFLQIKRVESIKIRKHFNTLVTDKMNFLMSDRQLYRNILCIRGITQIWLSTVVTEDAVDIFKIIDSDTPSEKFEMLRYMLNEYDLFLNKNQLELIIWHDDLDTPFCRLTEKKECPYYTRKDEDGELVVLNDACPYCAVNNI